MWRVVTMAIIVALAIGAGALRLESTADACTGGKLGAAAALSVWTPDESGCPNKSQKELP